MESAEPRRDSMRCASGGDSDKRFSSRGETGNPASPRPPPSPHRPLSASAYRLLPTAYCPETDDEPLAEINAALRRDAKPTTRRRRGTVGYRRDTADAAKW